MEEAEAHAAPAAIQYVGNIMLLQLALIMIAVGGLARQNAQWAITLVQVKIRCSPHSCSRSVL